MSKSNAQPVCDLEEAYTSIEHAHKFITIKYQDNTIVVCKDCLIELLCDMEIKEMEAESGV